MLKGCRLQVIPVVPMNIVGYEPILTAHSPSSTQYANGSTGTQTFQNPLIKEYTLNHSRTPNMI